MLSLLQSLFPFVFPILWFGGMFILALRWRSAMKAYFKRLESEIPELKNNPLVMRLYLPNYAPVYRQLRRDVWNAMRYSHSNPELERMRRLMWRRYIFAALWTLGFPICASGLVALYYITKGFTRLP